MFKRIKIMVMGLKSLDGMKFKSLVDTHVGQINKRRIILTVQSCAKACGRMALVLGRGRDEGSVGFRSCAVGRRITT